MIKGIAYQKVEISDEEYKYYQTLVSKYTDGKNKGSEYFNDLFKTDKAGKIIIITPTKSVPWEILFFIQNLMINQHLRSFDKRISKIEKEQLQ